MVNPAILSTGLALKGLQTLGFAGLTAESEFLNSFNRL
jgi:hypothetical protein